MTQGPPMHGGQLRAISERFGVHAAGLLDFSASINPEGPPAAVLEALRSGVDDLDALTLYPDLEQTDLKRAIALHLKVSSQNLVISNGFVPLLETALRTLKIETCRLPVPAFNEYGRVLARCSVEIEQLPLTPEMGFRYDPGALLDRQPQAILLANPQNPSGALYPRTEMLKLVAAAAAQGTIVLLDEAFIDYADHESFAEECERFPNLVVFRSVTKFFGIPGLRVAYAVGSTQLVREIEAAIAPWPVTTLAARGVVAALGDKQYAERTRTLNLRRRLDLASALEAIGVFSYRAAANFLLLRLPAGYDAEFVWRSLIVDHGIVLRLCSNYDCLPQGHLRTAVRDEGANARLVKALESVLGRREAFLRT